MGFVETGSGTLQLPLNARLSPAITETSKNIRPYPILEIDRRLSGDNLQCSGGTFQRGGRALYFYKFLFIAGEGGGLKRRLRCP